MLQGDVGRSSKVGAPSVGCGRLLDLVGRALLEPNPISAEMVDVEDELDTTTNGDFIRGAQFS
jgi:hypothetical protein